MMLTSADMPHDAQRCREVGVTEYAIKPIARNELLLMIQRALGHGVLEEDASLAPAASNGLQPNGSVAGLRILLAEDNLFNQKVAVGLLSRLGHTVEIADNGLLAIEKFSQGDFDIILMDVQMPEMDGFQATRRIRQLQSTTGKFTPIIAMTAHAMTGDREKCLAGGMDDYLSKPISRADLVSVLARNVKPDVIPAPPTPSMSSHDRP